MSSCLGGFRSEHDIQWNSLCRFVGCNGGKQGWNKTEEILGKLGLHPSNHVIRIELESVILFLILWFYPQPLACIKELFRNSCVFFVLNYWYLVEQICTVPGTLPYAGDKRDFSKAKQQIRLDSVCNIIHKWVQVFKLIFYVFLSSTVPLLSIIYCTFTSPVTWHSVSIC